MYEIMEWLVGKCESLLAFLSHWHIKAARIRLRNLRAYDSRIEYSLEQLELEQSKVQSEIDKIVYFLDQSYKEL